MLKMLMDPMGGIVMTNDGNAILREVSYVQILFWFALCLFGNQDVTFLCSLKKFGEHIVAGLSVYPYKPRDTCVT
jgi:hypothetical protein